MKPQRLAIVLTLFNFTLLLLFVAQAGFTTSQTAATTAIKTSLLEVVDDRGQVRALLKVEPDGEVVFRLRDSKGTIRVKLGAGETGSGLLLLDEATEPAIHMIARRNGTTDRPTTTSITLQGANSQPRIIKP
jgi:hypothetical protein